MGYLKDETLGTVYKRLLFIGGSSDNAGLTASLKAAGTDDGAGSINTAPFTLATGELNFGTNKLSFYDTGVYINSGADGRMNVVADGEVDIATAIFDLNSTGAVTLDTTDTSNGVKVGGSTSGVPIVIGHTTSETTISDNLTVTGTTTHTDKVTMASGKAVSFADVGEYISGNGTNLTIGSGADINLTATTDINIPANVGLTFGDDGEKIEGNGTKMTITGGGVDITGTAASTWKTTAGNITVDSNAGSLTIDGHTGVDIDASNSGKVAIDGAGGIDIGVASDVAIDVDSAALDIDASGAITIDGTSTIGIGTAANAGAITIGSNATARSVIMGNKVGASALTLHSGTGQTDISSTGEIEVTSTKNAASSIYLRANGGTSETIKIHSDQGTGAASIAMVSDAGGMDIDAVKIIDIDSTGTGGAGGVYIDSTDTTNGIRLGYATSGVPITIGHTTSETTIRDNCTVTGNLTVSGTASISGTLSYSDLTLSDATPILTMTNTETENTEGGREGTVIFTGNKGDGTDTNIATILADHQGTGNDYNGRLTLKVNTNSGALTNAAALTIASDLTSTFAGQVDGNAGLSIEGGNTLINQDNADNDFKVGSSSTDTMIMGDAGNNRVGINTSTPSATLSVGGTIAGTVVTASTTGPTDDVSVTGATVLKMDTSSNSVTIGGLAGGVAGQLLFVVKTNTANSAILEDQEGGGSQDIKLLSGANETITTFGGWMLVCDGSNWFALGK